LATTTHTLAARRYSLPALWHLLSLDAPTVAALWFALALKTEHLQVRAGDAAALAVGTWLLYAADRLLDARGPAQLQEERHRFHGANVFVFLGAMVCAVPGLLFLLTRMEMPLLRGYLLLGLVVAAYFAVIHTRAGMHGLPKELVVGVVFAAAVWMPAIVLGEARGVVAEMVCFGALCWVNCAIISGREHTALREAHWSTRLAVRHASLLLGLVAAAGLILFFMGTEFHAVCASVVLSAALLAGLHGVRERVGRLAFRVAADAALLTPVIFLIR
jgi:hypothetical protein